MLRSLFPHLKPTVALCTLSCTSVEFVEFVGEPFDVANQISDRAAAFTVLPTSAISNASNLPTKSDGAALCNIVIMTSLYAISEEANALPFITDATVYLLEIEAVFHGASFHKIALRNMRVFGDHAIGKAEVEFWIRIQMGNTEQDDVAQAF